jgi:hypothetical protein
VSETGDVVAALTPVVAALERLGVAYRVGGSVATSAYGMPRSTLDVDLVCDLTRTAVAPLVALLRDDYYVDADMIDEAIRLRRSFNVIHLATMLKVDVFVVKDRPFDQAAFSRCVLDTLEEGEQARRFALSTPEDMVLHKLDWYRAGDEVSERQWLDVLGVLKVQDQALDWAYVRRWAEQLGLSDLLERAMQDADVRVG